MSQWLQRYKYHNACDGYLTSLTELLCIMSRFVGTVNPAFGTSSVESVGVCSVLRLLAQREADFAFAASRTSTSVPFTRHMTMSFCRGRASSMTGTKARRRPKVSRRAHFPLPSARRGLLTARLSAPQTLVW